MAISVENDEKSFESSFEGSNPNPLDAKGGDGNVVSEHENDEIEERIANFEGEVFELKQKQKTFDEKRRDALNKILDIKGSIRVFCRVRPLLSTKNRRIQQPVSVGSEKIVVRSLNTKREFGFDKVFPEEASQEDVFAEVKPILRSALDGHNVCILAYGQTGTGKTFTMEGTDDRPGLVPRVLEELFRQSSSESSASFTFSISMLEVYLGSVRDLLAPRPYRRVYEPVSRCNINIQTDSKGVVEIDGLTEVEISNFTKASWWYTKGRRVRSTSWTLVNEESSRSHCLTRITIFRHGDAPGDKTRVSKLWMVDLGGSERLLKTGATGQTLDEGRAINLSLSALGDVIAGLRRKHGHVPYRNSKLTQILRDSLGDGSNVLMLVNISQSEEDVAETTCSLTFAKRARAVESNKELPEDLKKQKEKRIMELEEEMRHFEEECRKVGNQIKKTELLLSDTKKLISTSNPLLEEEKPTPTSPEEDSKGALVTPKLSEKPIKRSATNSLPRFMNSTAASRLRVSVTEREIDGQTRMWRSWTRSSVQLSSASPSITQILVSKHSNGNCKFPSQKNGDRNTPLGESTKCNVLDSNLTAMTRSKTVAYSDPNLKAKMVDLRRRMSDLI